ncbi:glutamine--tRNA ligase/YqeY domain fusion protein [Parahaliea mediterranea]|uniref:glutamine--tRNA ligase/YqeY domain fusion protein n=1 Tax=Parahaliea mediterranea TaxID=651086 RepID=UPI000E2ED86C|nr:glutamine--tRNA ligase/YqeY domain fusion protein [Parahaliea mediterranea]
MDNKPANNFLHQIVAEDLEAGRVSEVITRFPPEPNGYLHVGHAKSICLNFGMAERFGGQCNLRFDDTNPEKESPEYVASIQEDVRWLGYEWAGEVRYASSYFQQFYDWAVHLVEQGHAYVCDLNAEQAREYRGTLTEPGKNSPYRERSVEENLDLLARMRAGEFDEGSKVLRARIDMAAPNMNLRDPILYRIRKAEHHQTGNQWCIYPTYDFAHGQEDAIEGVTHSICTLEFEDHRPLYDWLLDHLPVPSRPRQYEFGRLNLNYTVTSKRKLKQLVDEGVVAGWDDPRMPTIAGMRRRGFTPASIRKFCEMIGVTRSDGVVDVAMLEHAIRDDLNENAPRAMCVLRPLKVVLTDYPEGQVERLSAPAHPSREDLGSRELPFTREIYIDADDFREEANKKFKRLVLGKRVRLRNAYVIEADSVVKDAAGNITEVHAHTVPNTIGLDPEDGIKPKGVIQWVSASAGRQATVRLYDRLFTDPAPDKGDKDFMALVNPASLTVVEGAWIEPGLAAARAEQSFQFEREGYFVADRHEHSEAAPVFNMTIGLRDTWNNG